MNILSGKRRKIDTNYQGVTNDVDRVQRANSFTKEFIQYIDNLPNDREVRNSATGTQNMIQSTNHIEETKFNPVATIVSGGGSSGQTYEEYTPRGRHRRDDRDDPDAEGILKNALSTSTNNQRYFGDTVWKEERRAVMTPQQLQQEERVSGKPVYQEIERDTKRYHNGEGDNDEGTAVPVTVPNFEEEKYKQRLAELQAELEAKGEAYNKLKNQHSKGKRERGVMQDQIVNMKKLVESKEAEAYHIYERKLAIQKEEMTAFAVQAEMELEQVYTKKLKQTQQEFEANLHQKMQELNQRDYNLQLQREELEEEFADQQRAARHAQQELTKELDTLKDTSTQQLQQQSQYYQGELNRKDEEFKKQGTEVIERFQKQINDLGGEYQRQLTEQQRLLQNASQQDKAHFQNQITSLTARFQSDQEQMKQQFNQQYQYQQQQQQYAVPMEQVQYQQQPQLYQSQNANFQEPSLYSGLTQNWAPEPIQQPYQQYSSSGRDFASFGNQQMPIQSTVSQILQERTDQVQFEQSAQRLDQIEEQYHTRTLGGSNSRMNEGDTLGEEMTAVVQQQQPQYQRVAENDEFEYQRPMRPAPKSQQQKEQEQADANRREQQASQRTENMVRLQYEQKDMVAQQRQQRQAIQDEKERVKQAEIQAEIDYNYNQKKAIDKRATDAYYADQRARQQAEEQAATLRKQEAQALLANQERQFRQQQEAQAKQVADLIERAKTKKIEAEKQDLLRRIHEKAQKDKEEAQRSHDEKTKAFLADFYRKEEETKQKAAAKLASQHVYVPPSPEYIAIQSLNPKQVIADLDQGIRYNEQLPQRVQNVINDKKLKQSTQKSANVQEKEEEELGTWVPAKPITRKEEEEKKEEIKEKKESLQKQKKKVKYIENEIEVQLDNLDEELNEFANEETAQSTKGKRSKSKKKSSTAFVEEKTRLKNQGKTLDVRGK